MTDSAPKKHISEKLHAAFNPRAEKLVNVQEWREKYEEKLSATLSRLDKVKRAVLFDPMHLVSGLRQAFNIAREKVDNPYFVPKSVAERFESDGRIPEADEIYVMQDTILDGPGQNSLISKSLQKFSGTQGRMNKARLEAVNDCKNFLDKLKNGEIVRLPMKRGHPKR